MTDTRYSVLAIGNAIVDVIADATDEFLEEQKLDKGSMRLIDEAEAERLYGLMGSAREVSGGSAGNTAAGLAALDVKTGFIGQVADDQLGAIYKHDIEAAGVDFLVAPSPDVGVATARCLILVTPDAERTMNTFLGASQKLPPQAIDEEVIASAEILYLEGYLWDPPGAIEAMSKAIDYAKKAGRKVAFTLSDTFCVERHRAEFMELIDNGRIDILFANEDEVKALAREGLNEAIDIVAAKVPLLVVTRSEKGAIAMEDGYRARVGAQPIKQLVDTTGAGDLFAAGFLAGQSKGLDTEASLRLGAVAAAEVIQHYGARPEEDLRALASKVLGG